MSNKKKREYVRENVKNISISKYEKEVVGMLKQYVQDGHPFDRKQQEAFYSGAMWGGRNPMWQTKILYILIGAGSLLIGEAFYILFQYLTK